MTKKLKRWDQGWPKFWDYIFVGGIVTFMVTVGYQLYSLWLATEHVGVRLV